jgi:hypothetical protein
VARSIGGESFSFSCKQQPIQLNKDMLMSFKCENVSSVANAMAQLQHQWQCFPAFTFYRFHQIFWGKKWSEMSSLCSGVDKSFMISLSMYNHNEKGSGSALQLQLHDLILYVLFRQSCIAANSVGLYPKPSWSYHDKVM